MGWSIDGKDDGGRKDGSGSRRPVRYVDTNVIMKRTCFGGFVGGVTGSLLSMSDAYRSRGGTSATSTATRMMRAAPIGGAVLGTFFAAFNCVKYTLDYNFDKTSEVDFLHPGVAAVSTLAPFFLIKSVRRHVGYACVLVALDIAGEQGFL